MPTGKQRRAASLSFSSLSAITHDDADDTAGITRSSLTQESFHNDSCSHTWTSSFTASVPTAPLLLLRPKTRADATTWTTLGDEKAEVNALPTPARESDDAAAVMDVFDLALAVDVQQRKHRHHHHHHHRRRRHASKHEDSQRLSDPANSPVQNSAALPAATAAPPSSTRGTAENMMCNNVTGVHVDAHERVNTSSHKNTTPRANSSAAAVHHQQVSADVPLPHSFHRDAQYQHLKMLLNETRNLHAALWQQLQELQQQEERENAHRSRNLCTSRAH